MRVCVYIHAFMHTYIYTHTYVRIARHACMHAWIYRYVYRTTNVIGWTAGGQGAGQDAARGHALYMGGQQERRARAWRRREKGSAASSQVSAAGCWCRWRLLGFVGLVCKLPPLRSVLGQLARGGTARMAEILSPESSRWFQRRAQSL